MDVLDLLLQVHLASDNAAVQHLPSTLSSLSSSDYSRSQHLRKFCTRLTALLHSKEPAPRWAGILIAEHAFKLNKDAVIDHAHSWVTVVLPMLSRQESTALWKASILLLDTIFVTTGHLAEFQRQVTNPNASKFGFALLALAGNADEDLQECMLSYSVTPYLFVEQITALTSLGRVVAAYPTLLRPLHGQATALSLRFLQGRYPNPQPTPLVIAAAQLDSVLHLTGGKVGGANIWKKSIDDALAAGTTQFCELRSTFEDGRRHDASTADPVVVVPHALDALRGTICRICHLLKSPSPRPLPIPVGSVVKLCVQLLRANIDEHLERAFEKSRRAMEVAVVPEIWFLGCELLRQACASIGHYISGFVPQLLHVLVAHLERPEALVKKAHILQAFTSLLDHAYPTENTVLLSRAVKALLYYLARIVVPRHLESEGQGRSKKRKVYEGEELFNDRSSDTSVSMEGETFALQCLRRILRNPALPSHLHDLSARLIAGIAMDVPTGANAMFRQIVSETVVELAGGRATMGRAAGAIVRTVPCHDSTQNAAIRHLDVLLRPRVPVVSRARATLDADILFEADRIQQHAVAASVGLVAPQLTTTHASEDSMAVDPVLVATVTQPVVTTPRPVTTVPQPQPTVSSTTPLSSHPAGAAPDYVSSGSRDSTTNAFAPIPIRAPDAVVDSARPSKTAEIIRPNPPAPASDGSDDDEEMPTIDMRSDSEDE